MSAMVGSSEDERGGASMRDLNLGSLARHATSECLLCQGIRPAGLSYTLKNDPPVETTPVVAHPGLPWSITGKPHPAKPGKIPTRRNPAKSRAAKSPCHRVKLLPRAQASTAKVDGWHRQAEPILLRTSMFQRTCKAIDRVRVPALPLGSEHARHKEPREAHFLMQTQIALSCATTAAAGTQLGAATSARSASQSFHAVTFAITENSSRRRAAYGPHDGPDNLKFLSRGLPIHVHANMHRLLIKRIPRRTTKMWWRYKIKPCISQMSCKASPRQRQRKKKGGKRSYYPQILLPTDPTTHRAWKRKHGRREGCRRLAGRRSTNSCGKQIGGFQQQTHPAA